MLTENKKTQAVYAVKSLKKEAILLDNDTVSVMSERRVLAMVGGCPFLTQLFATFQTRDRMFFVMEFVQGGDLFFQISGVGKFEEKRARFYAAEIALGLFYLHDHHIIYRDLKLDNVMLAADGHVKVGHLFVWSVCFT
jgi:serine/threonine protein kinase